MRCPRLSGKGELAGTMRYNHGRWELLNRYLDHGRLEISYDAAERESALSLWAARTTCSPTRCRWRARRRHVHSRRNNKRDDLDPDAYLRCPQPHRPASIKRVAEFLPWNTATAPLLPRR